MSTSPLWHALMAKSRALGLTMSLRCFGALVIMSRQRLHTRGRLFMMVSGDKKESVMHMSSSGSDMICGGGECCEGRK